jgi:hypothetical protein
MVFEMISSSFGQNVAVLYSSFGIGICAACPYSFTVNLKR